MNLIPYLKKNFVYIFVVFVFSITAFAAVQSKYMMSLSKKMIPNLNQSIKIAQTKTNLPIIFPTRIPADSQIKTYYPFIKITKNGYIIYVDSTPICHGVHVCNIGSVEVENNGKIGTYYDMNKKKLTMSVRLKHHVQGYFTPSHAMGDFWPAMIQWQKNNTLYTIRWNMKPSQEKAALTQMANDIIRLTI